MFVWSFAELELWCLCHILRFYVSRSLLNLPAEIVALDAAFLDQAPAHCPTQGAFIPGNNPSDANSKDTDSRRILTSQNTKFRKDSESSLDTMIEPT